MSTTTRLLDQPSLEHDNPKVRGIRRQPRRRRAVLKQPEGPDRDQGFALADGIRPTSEIDEARRRVKRNVQGIERELRLGSRRGDERPAEAILTEMTHRLQSMAAYQRTICRSGQFDEADLAIYLKHVTSFLSRSRGQAADSGTGAPGGWVLEDAGRTLAWKRDPTTGADDRGAIGVGLGDAVGFLPPRWREAVRRAVCACAVMFPPGLFNWRSWSATEPASDPRVRPGDLGIRLRSADDDVRVHVWVADQSLGLPRSFDHEAKAALGPQIAARLLSQTQETHPFASDPAIFEVAFVCAHS